MRRFIAGAVCPECREMDRIVVETEGGERRRRCVHCGFTDARPAAAAGPPATRLTRSRRADDVPVSAVRIVDPERRDS